MNVLVAEAIRKESDDIVEEVVEEVVGRAGAGVPIAGEPESVVRDIARLLVETAVADGPEPEDGHAAVSGAASRLVGAGVPPEPATRVFRAAVSVVRSRVLAAWRAVLAGEASAEEAAEAMGAAAGENADRELDLVRVFEAACRRADEESRDPARARPAFLRELLDRPVVEPWAVQRRAAALGLSLAPPLGVVLVGERDPGADALDAPEGFDARLARCVSAVGAPVLGPVPVDPAPAHPGFAVLLVPECSTGRAAPLRSALREACTTLDLVAVHETAPRVDDLPAVFARLRVVAPLLGPCAGHLGRVTALADLLAYRLMAALLAEEQEALVRATVGPLMSTEGEARSHLETLRAWAEAHGRVAEVARLLHLSEGTVRRRKSIIEELTGLDPDRDSLRFTLALAYLGLYEGELPPPGDPWWRQG